MEVQTNSKNSFDNVLQWRITFANAAFLLMLLAFVTGLFFLNADQSLWLDELYSVTTANPDSTLRDVWQKIERDVHPPFFLLFLHYWMKLFGTSEFAVRAPSLIASIATIAFSLWYFRPIVGPRATGIFCVMLATSYGIIWYSQEARSYALMILLSVALTGASLRIIENVKKGHLDPNPLRLFAFCATILSLTHYFGFILYCSSTAAILILLHRRFDLLWRNALFFVLPAVPSLLWVFYHYGQIQPNVLNDFWITKPSIGDFLKFLSLLFGISYLWLAMTPIIAFAIARQGAPARRLALFAIFNVSIGVAFALTISLRHPMITSRNLLIFLPIIQLLTASGLGWLWDQQSLNARFRLAGKCIAALFISITVITGPLIAMSKEKSDWRGSAANLLSIEACRKSSIFVMGGYGTKNQEHYTNSRYEDVAIRFIELHKQIPVAESDRKAVFADPCPVILWGIETQGYSQDWVQSQILDYIEGEIKEVRSKGTVVFILSSSLN